MPKVSEQHAEQRRRQILDAALACFAREGFHRTTMQDIFREADLSPGAVYTYFFGKDDLVRAIADEGLALARRTLEGLDERTRAEEALDRMLAAFTRLDADGQLFLRTAIQLWGEALRDPKVMALLRRSIDHDIETLGRLFGEPHARVTIALFHGLMLQRTWYPEMDVAAFSAAARALVASTAAVGESDSGS